MQNHAPINKNTKRGMFSTPDCDHSRQTFQQMRANGHRKSTLTIGSTPKFVCSLIQFRSLFMKNERQMLPKIPALHSIRICQTNEMLSVQIYKNCQFSNLCWRKQLRDELFFNDTVEQHGNGKSRWQLKSQRVLTYFEASSILFMKRRMETHLHKFLKQRIETCSTG